MADYTTTMTGDVSATLSSDNIITRVTQADITTSFTTDTFPRLLLGGENTLTSVSTTYIHFTTGVNAIIASGKSTATYVAVASDISYAVTTSDSVLLGSNNVIATVAASTITYTVTISGEVVVSSDPTSYLEFIDVDSITFNVAQSGVIGLWLGSENLLTTVSTDYDTYATERGSIAVSGAMSYGLYNPPIIAFEQDTQLVLSGTASINIGTGNLEYAHETWVVNGYGFDITMYSNWKFNSYAELGSTYFAAATDGIYLLEGEHDNGTKIHTGAICGPHHFNMINRKFIRSVRLGEGNDEAQVVVEGNTINNSVAAERLRDKFIGSREILDRELTVKIQDFDEISHLEIELVSKQRD